jgi:hypothetical protein
MNNQDTADRESELIEEITSTLTENPEKLAKALIESMFQSLEGTDELTKVEIGQLHILWGILNNAIELKNLR